MVRPLLIMCLIWFSPFTSAIYANEVDYVLILEKGITNHARPRLAKLTEETKAMNNMLQAHCENGAGLNAPEVRAQFEATALAWAAIGHLRWGPASEDYRYARMFFGSDPAEYAWQKLIKHLFNANYEVLEVEAFRKQTTAIQGLTALEHLLYPSINLSFFEDYPCHLAIAIARNMHQTTTEIAQGWMDGSDYITNLRDPAPDHPFVQNSREAAMQFFKPIGGGLPYIVSEDFDAVLKANVNSARPKYVNYYKSDLSQKSLLIRMQALEDLYLYGGFAEALAPKDIALHRKIWAGFQNIEGLIIAINIPIKDAVLKPAERKNMRTIAIEIDALWRLLSYDMAEHFDFVIGFNLFDGD